MFYGSKSKTKAKQKEPQRSPRILGLGLIKLDFYLNLNDELIQKHNIDFSKIQSPRDLAFIAEEPTLLDLIQISSSDTLSNILLYLNKASIQKSFVELITLSPIKTHPEEEFIKKIFTHVTEHNYLFSNEMSVTTIPNKISFAFKNGKKLLKYFDIETDYDPYAYADEALIEDDKKNADEKLNNLYERINASIDKTKNEIQEIENYNDVVKNDFNKAQEIRRNEDDDVMVRDDIYNDLSNNIDASKHLHDDFNYKINEVNEDEANSNQNQSVNNRVSNSRKSYNVDPEEQMGNMSQKSFNKEEAISQREDNKEINQSNKSQNKSRITNKSQSRKEENLEEEGKDQMENQEDYLENNAENEIKENNEIASEPERFKILKTNSVNRGLDDSNNVDKQDDLNDFEMEDLEEIKGENLDSSHLNTQSKKKEITQPSQRNNAAEGEEKSKHSKKNTDQNSKNNYASVNSKSNNDPNDKQTSSKRYESINIKEESKKHIRPLYEGSDLSRHDKSSISGQKLLNIPAACEIEEYDFLFIDLEEFINFHTHGFHLKELAEFMKNISSNDKKPRIVLNYPNILINLNVVNLELLETIMNIMSFTDIFLFEKKECLAFFNMLNQMNYEKDLNEKQLMDYFFKEIPHQKAAVSKLGLFLDELQKFSVAEQKKDKVLNNLSYEINLHPKINHFNQKIVDEYKKIMAINNSYFKSIFFGGYFSSYIFNEDQYTSFFTGAESTKRILEIFKNKIDFPTNPDYYIIKLQKSRIFKNMEKEKLRKKEEKFVLDCVNKTNSTIKSYNPLFDENLNAFFASGVIRKQLKEKGFINTNGFVLYDSSYKSVLGGPPKPKKRLDTSERERHLLLAIKQNKELLSTDLESFSKSLKGQSPTNRKLPLPSFDLNSSNLYISSKIKNLKASKKKLKPIYSSSRRSNSKTKERNQEPKNTNSSKSPKEMKEGSNSKKNNTSNQNKSNKKNESANKSKDTDNYNNDSLDALSKNLQKDKEDNYNYIYKEKSKVSSRRESIMDGNSENEYSKSQAKSKTYTVSMGNNQRLTEAGKNELHESNNNHNANHTQSRREIDNSNHITNNNIENSERQEDNNNAYDNLEASGEDKDKELENQENLDQENQNENKAEDHNNNEEMDFKENKELGEEENQNENHNENVDVPKDEKDNIAEGEMDQNQLEEGENKKDAEAENNEENKQNNEENNDINAEAQEENEKPKEEDKIEAEGKN